MENNLDIYKNIDKNIYKFKSIFIPSNILHIVNEKNNLIKKISFNTKINYPNYDKILIDIIIKDVINILEKEKHVISIHKLNNKVIEKISDKYASFYYLNKIIYDSIILNIYGNLFKASEFIDDYKIFLKKFNYFNDKNIEDCTKIPYLTKDYKRDCSYDNIPNLPKFVVESSIADPITFSRYSESSSRTDELMIHVNNTYILLNYYNLLLHAKKLFTSTSLEYTTNMVLCISENYEVFSNKPFSYENIFSPVTHNLVYNISTKKKYVENCLTICQYVCNINNIKQNNGKYYSKNKIEKSSKKVKKNIKIVVSRSEFSSSQESLSQMSSHCSMDIMKDSNKLNTAGPSIACSDADSLDLQKVVGLTKDRMILIQDNIETKDINISNGIQDGLSKYVPSKLTENYISNEGEDYYNISNDNYDFDLFEKDIFGSIDDNEYNSFDIEK